MSRLADMNIYGKGKTIMNYRKLVMAISLYGALVFIACSSVTRSDMSNNPSPPSSGTVVASGMVGSGGGSVQVTDATDPLFGVRIDIPPGALTQTTNITINTVSSSPLSGNFQQRGPLVEFGPDGLQFQVPAKITIPSTGEHNAGTTNLIYVLEDGVFRPIAEGDPSTGIESPSQVLERTTHTLSVHVSHLSVRAVLGRPDIENAITGAVPSEAVQIPVDLNRCRRCANRPVPVESIVVHSTNDEGSEFASIIAWILGSIGSPTEEAFFATYYIDKDGHVIQLVPDNIQTSHVAGHNTGTIGIELFDGESGYTNEQKQALINLVQKLMNENQVPLENVLRHKDLSNGDPLHQDPFQWSDNQWAQFKSDLGRSPTPSPTPTPSPIPPGSLTWTITGTVVGAGGSVPVKGSVVLPRNGGSGDFSYSQGLVKITTSPTSFSASSSGPAGRGCTFSWNGSGNIVESTTAFNASVPISGSTAGCIPVFSISGSLTATAPK